MLQIDFIKAFDDNYIYAFRDDESSNATVIDPGEAGPVIDYLAKNNLNLSHILCTHHHSDHTGGNLALKEKFHCRIYGYGNDAARINGIDVKLSDNEEFEVFSHKIKVIFIPGHTSGHIAYYFKDDGVLFCGDTLFSMGCGRLFEGTPQQMYKSLNRLMLLPFDTNIYCGHEYTIKNGQFALTLEPNNQDLNDRMSEVEYLIEHQRPTLPSTIEVELKTNPFLRVKSKEIRETLQMPDADAVAVFARIRELKDKY